MMDTLIAELETATEGSRELDSEVAQAFGWRFCEKVLTYKGVDRCWFDPDSKPYISVDPPLFTQSLDVALSSIPEGHGPSEITWRPKPRAVVVRYRTQTDEDGDFFAGVAHTSALALCIAALRARQAMEGE